MCTRADLLAGIIEAPDDDTPRLIFADWLDGHGEPDRAEFIRTQLARARLEPEDPAAFDLEERERDLLAGHDRRWRREWPVLEKQDLDYRRGFLSAWCASGQSFRAHAEALARVT